MAFRIGKKKEKEEEGESTPSKVAVAEKKEKAVTKNAPQQKAQEGVADYAWVLRRPRITEKASMEMERGVYTFEIDPRANKHDVSQAVRYYYKVTPKKIRIAKRPSTKLVSQMRRTRGRTKAIKKAYVYLREGDRIEIA